MLARAPERRSARTQADADFVGAKTERRFGLDQIPFLLADANVDER